MTDSQSTPRGASPGQADSTSPTTPLEVAAISLHEMFTAYRKAGFTEDQAVKIVAQCVVYGANRA